MSNGNADWPAQGARAVLVDSVAELRAGDAGCLAVTGSHGGISAGRYALAARPLLVVFNDAGVGKDAAGIAALDFLQQHQIAACAVLHASARIGEARSTLEQGIIGHANAVAARLGAAPGMRCNQLIDALTRRTA